MAKDQTAQRFQSIPHDHRHGHLVPVPHLRPEWSDDHGPDFAHHHVHIRGGGNHYDHHGALDHDHGRSALKPDHEPADNGS